MSVRHWFLMFSFTALSAQAAPVIDMHLHASLADDNGPPPLAICVPATTAEVPHFDSRQPWQATLMVTAKKPTCEDPVWSPESDAGVRDGIIKVLKRNEIVGVLSGPPERVREWVALAPEHFIGSLQLNLDRDPYSAEDVRELLETGDFKVLGEISNQYNGIGPDDERMRPYWAVAEALDVPVAIHMGGGPPGTAHFYPDYRVALSNPLLLEPVLKRHPRMRVSVMHYGEPFVTEMIALMYAYPQVYADIGGQSWMRQPESFYADLKAFFDAGFGHRVMFGSDAMNWPGVIEPSLHVVQNAPFLSAEQKRDVLYNNARQFLRLDESAAADAKMEATAND